MKFKSLPFLYFLDNSKIVKLLTSMERRVTLNFLFDKFVQRKRLPTSVKERAISEHALVLHDLAYK